MEELNEGKEGAEFNGMVAAIGQSILPCRAVPYRNLP